MSGAGCQEKKVWVGQDEDSTIGRIKVCCLNCSRHCPVDNDGHLSPRMFRNSLSLHGDSAGRAQTVYVVDV